MKKYLLYTAGALLGVLCMVQSVSLFLAGDSLKSIAQMAGLGLLLMLGTAFLMYDDRSREPKKVSAKRLLKGNDYKLELPYDTLSRHFRTLAEHDELTVAEKDFLSWNSGAFASVSIEPLGKGDWLGIYRIDADHAMSNTVVKSICAERGIQAPKSVLVKPHGVLLYQDGELHHYPAFLKAEFEDALLSTVLSQGADFDKWVREYGEEDF